MSEANGTLGKQANQISSLKATNKLIPTISFINFYLILAAQGTKFIFVTLVRLSVMFFLITNIL